MEDRHKIEQSYPLRMPSEMRQQLKLEAVENGRSLNSEIVQRLKASLQQEVKREEALQ